MERTTSRLLSARFRHLLRVAFDRVLDNSQTQSAKGVHFVTTIRGSAVILRCCRSGPSSAVTLTRKLTKHQGPHLSTTNLFLPPRTHIPPLHPPSIKVAPPHSLHSPHSLQAATPDCHHYSTALTATHTRANSEWIDRLSHSIALHIDRHHVGRA